MKLHQVRALIAVAQAGSIQAGAQLLNLTQPALGKAISELEKEFGVPLLVRSSRGARLSSYGEALLPLCRGIQGQIENMHQEVSELRGALDARLRLATVSVAVDAILGDALVEFRRRHPLVRLSIAEMRPMAVVEAVRSGDADVGVIGSVLPLRTPDLQHQPLHSVEMVIAVSGSHNRRGNRRCRLEQLIDRDWLSFDPLGDDNGYLRHLFDRHGLPMPTNVIQCTSPILGYEIAKHSPVVACWSRTTLDMTRGLMGGSAMVPVDIREQMPPVTVELLYRNELMLTNVARRFVRILHHMQRIGSPAPQSATSVARPDDAALSIDDASAGEAPG